MMNNALLRVRCRKRDTQPNHALCSPPPSPHQEALPFAIVGSTDSKTVGDKVVCGRQTRSGFVEVDNPDHCETSNLREMLLRFVNLSSTLSQASLVHVGHMMIITIIATPSADPAS